ncbi:MAG TPA: GNAT family N-acetyltransferase [Flavobacterium sp.]|nr:GNAT family N-acetyltransferase [Flavobacterium sp.]
MHTEISIRNYKNTDKPAVIALLQLNTPQYFSPEEEADLIFYLDNEIEQYFVVEYDNKIIGSGGFNFSEDLTTGKISWDILHTEYQGKGIGGMLLKHRMEKLKALNHIQLITVRTSQLVYAFYEKNGFELKEIVKDYWAAGFDLYRMEYTKK